VIRLFLVAAPATAVIPILTSVLQDKGREREATVISGAFLFVNLGLCAAGAAVGDAFGAAMGYCIGSWAQLTVAALIALIGLRPNLRGGPFAEGIDEKTV
jgi:O-antigen/teichoic acid export membrane protein